MGWPSLAQLRFLLVGEYPYGAVGGLAMSLIVVVLAVVLGFLIGVGMGIGRLSKKSLIRRPCQLYVEVIRATPLIMVLFWFYFLIPNVLGIRISLFWTVTVSLTTYVSAYLAETVRAGLLAIPKGQPEAAYSIGLTPFQVLVLITLPQALKMMIPTFVGIFIALFKESPAAMLVGFSELMDTGYSIATLHLQQTLSTFFIIGVVFFVLCFGLSRFSIRLERKLNPERYRQTGELPPDIDSFSVAVTASSGRISAIK
jgi:polar amino acid transport system permease protein